MIMIFHRRCLNVPPLTLVTGIFIFILFVTKQMKDLYERNQKYYRMENYNKFGVKVVPLYEYHCKLIGIIRADGAAKEVIIINEVSQSMNTLEVSANRSAQALHRLTAVLKQHNYKPPR